MRAVLWPVGQRGHHLLFYGLDVPALGKRNDSQKWAVSFSKMLKVKFFLKNMFFFFFFSFPPD